MSEYRINFKFWAQGRLSTTRTFVLCWNKITFSLVKKFSTGARDVIFEHFSILPFKLFMSFIRFFTETLTNKKCIRVSLQRKVDNANLYSQVESIYNVHFANVYLNNFPNFSHV